MSVQIIDVRMGVGVKGSEAISHYLWKTPRTPPRTGRTSRA
jgi:hypothetical protein